MSRRNWRRSLDQLDFLVVHDLYLTETAKRADVVLPAVSWMEMSGTLTNMDRHVQLLRRALLPLGDSRPLWELLTDLAGLMGTEMAYSDAAEVFDAIAASVPAYAGLSHTRLDWDARMQWPVVDADSTGTPILFTDAFGTPDGRGQLVPVAQGMTPAPLTAETVGSYELILTTNRGPEAHMAETHPVPDMDLTRITPTSDLIIHPKDATRRNIVTGDRVRLVSRYGTAADVTALVRETNTARPRASGLRHRAVVAREPNQPTLDAPWRIGELRVCAVDVRPLESARRPEMVAAGGD